jgi:hypothetical protein
MAQQCSCQYRQCGDFRWAFKREEALMPVNTVLAAAMMSLVAAHLPPIIIPAQSAAVNVRVRLSADREQLLAAAADQKHDVVLDLAMIEAESAPGAYFEVFVYAEGEVRGHSVGNLALYGTGIRSESHGVFQPAHVLLVITRELHAALKKNSTILITFVAQGAGGAATAARSLTAVTIHKPSISIVPRMQDEQSKRE